MNRWHSAVICFCMLPAAVMAQFEKKVSVYIDAGVTASPKSERLNTKGQPTDIFGAYKSGQLVGGAILYSLDDHFSVGGSVRAMRAAKPYYSLLVTSVGGMAKYNILPSGKKISPYVFFEGNLSFVSMGQKNHISNYQPPGSTADTVPVANIKYTYAAYNLFFVPAFGIYSGGGVDIRLKESLNFFVQAGFNECFAKNAKLIKANNLSNTSNLGYWNLVVGIRLNLFKKKTFY